MCLTRAIFFFHIDSLNVFFLFVWGFVFGGLLNMDLDVAGVCASSDWVEKPISTMDRSTVHHTHVHVHDTHVLFAQTLASR